MITGASGGLGLHFAKLLAGQGAAVALAARRVERLADAVRAIEADGGKALAVALDVADATSIGPAFDQVQAELGSISILVNNAGVSGAGRALDLTPETWDQTFGVNTRGVFFSAQAAAQRMIASGVAERGEARIVNIASVAGYTVLPGLSAYCASKAATVMLTKSLAREWARQRIAVNAICPGYIETDINAEWFASEAGQAQVRGFPRRRLLKPEDLDAALLMLAGPAAASITGTLVTVDDGQSLPGGG